METIVINNFGGRLTRIINGELNSGFAKFDTSFGYDPFTKPMNLTWLATPQSVEGVTDTVVGGTTQIGAGSVAGQLGSQALLVGILGKVYTFDIPPLIQTVIPGSVSQINNTPSIVSITSVGTAAAYGVTPKIYGVNQKLYIAGDTNIVTAGSAVGANRITMDGSVSVIASSNYIKNIFHPMDKFSGKLVFGNGPSLGVIDATGTVTSSVFTVNTAYGPQFSELNPPLPATQKVVDLDRTPDGNYLLLTGNEGFSQYMFGFTSGFFPGIGNIADASATSPGEGGIYGWNGVDPGITTFLSVPGGTPVATNNYLQDQRIFTNDTLGAALVSNTEKLLTMPNNLPPTPMAISTTGNFLSWATTEVSSTVGRGMSFYYYGSLDAENPVGLYRLVRIQSYLDPPSAIYKVPYQQFVRGAYNSGDLSFTGSSSGNGPNVISYGAHIISTYNLSSTVGVFNPQTSKLYYFEVTSSSSLPPQFGVYETQTQLFQKRIHVEQVRVYCESTVSGNGFKLDIIDIDGNVLENGSFTYTFVAGDDLTKLQGSLQRINFNPQADAGFGFAIRVTNTGTTNMTIKKIEVDWGPEGR